MNNKVIIVTGASSGIGKALVYEFAGRGAKVVMAARNIQKLNEIKADLSSNKILTIETDVTKEDDCRNLVEKTIEKWGRVDVLINNAGISMRALFAEMDLDVMRRLMDVNFWGTVYCTKYALPYILKQRGSIAGVISIAGYIGLPGRTAYSASKFAIRGFLDTLRVENLKNHLHVLVVAPGFTASNVRNKALKADGSEQGSTPRDESKMMTAEKVAFKIAKAVKKRKRSLILTFVEGKFTVFLGKFFPELLDKLAYQHMAKETDSPFK